MPSCRRARRGASRRIYALFYNKWYFDELYDALFVQPALAIGRLLLEEGRRRHHRRARPRRHRRARPGLAGVLMRFQTGYLYHYAFVMLIGVAALVTYFMLSVR